MSTIRSKSERWNSADAKAPILGVNERGVPIIAARRVTKYPDNDLLVVQCPFCGRSHTHDACGKNSPFGAGDGSRVPHCLDLRPDTPDYIIVEQKETPHDAIEPTKCPACGKRLDYLIVDPTSRGTFPRGWCPRCHERIRISSFSRKLR